MEDMWYPIKYELDYHQPEFVYTLYLVWSDLFSNKIYNKSTGHATNNLLVR